ncbi:glutamine amidotransferase-related protein [Saccharothrix lopnurensis]|uniref:CTP synthase (glutamine hydrolyzing) n=1 Tax=Saccharothrix lopnurensis TaxID=1670621 RepID=A0ABW1PFV3_9PSEU
MDDGPWIARVALVGERSAGVRAHSRYATLFDALWRRAGIAVDAYWTPTTDVSGLAAFDGVWLVPGSPYLSQDGALAAVRAAREGDLPFLATCGGFSHAVLEFARSVCGLAGVAHAENAPDAREHLIVPSAKPLVGHERRIRLRPGSLAERVLGAGSTTERHHSGHELDPAYAPLLEAGGLRLTGHDDDGVARVAELPGHRFFLATAFQPELTADPVAPHPIVTAFAEAAVAAAAA